MAGAETNRVAANLQPRKIVRAAKHTVAEHALPSVAVCLGLGFGVGLLVAIALPSGRPPEPDYGMMQRYGRNFFDAISRATPDWMTGKKA
jgi:hypothetical protein